MPPFWVLIAMCLLSSVTGKDIGSLWDKGEIEPALVDSRQDRTLCGRRPAITKGRIFGYDTFDGDKNNYNLNKILGGTFATHGEVPWQVNIHVDNKFRCGGVIVNAYWVLTSAECVYPDTSSWRISVTAGDHILYQPDAGQQDLRVQQVKVHESYNRLNKDYNIALLNVARERDGLGIQFNDYVQPVCLPVQGEEPADGTELTISGWGHTAYNTRQMSDVLKKSVLTVYNHRECEDRMYSYTGLTNRMICAGRTGGDVACAGDGGGPATFQVKGVYVLAGILSHGKGCRQPTSPLVVTDVLALRDWIDSTMKTSGSQREAILPSRS
ncbi:unnamed protein product [Candidula unifasciata]|uniref:Peptidase S1 domain-containing protein n=1 Tax=Candidula unifasciata TaxID=100452 RepID=A0A8S3YQF5_9EUPU|nr:unnamed protein product [Candidula unifasciata]